MPILLTTYHIWRNHLHAPLPRHISPQNILHLQGRDNISSTLHSAQVIVRGIIPDTYFIKKGVLKQKTRKPSISVTTQDEETGTNHLPNTALITTNPAETVNKPKPQTTPKKSKLPRGSKPTRKDELYRPSKSQRQHIRNYVHIQPYKFLTPRRKREHINPATQKDYKK